MSKKKIVTVDILKEATKGAFIKLNPKYMMKNPVMFVVEIGFLVTLFLTFFPYTFGDKGQNIRGYNGLVSFILLITVLFANFAEEIGRAHV